MKKLIYFLIFLSLPLALCIETAWADIDVIRKIVDKNRENNQEKDTKETEDAVETEKDKKEVTGFDKKNFKENLKKAKKMAKQAKDAYNTAKDAYDTAQDMIDDPFGTGMEIASKLQDKLKNDEDAPDEDKAEAVKEMYSRAKDSSIDVAVEQQKATNLLLIANTSSLFAKAMVLRQELNEEEGEEPSLETKEDAMRASTEAQLKSLERWNEILKMQGYISSYDSFLENQNYARDQEEEEK